ncbi:cobalt-precorrin-6x reductase [compost metagenome]
MVTKESGAEGSLDEKVYAALDMGIYVILIARPQAFYGEYGRVYGSFEEIVSAVTAFNKK